MKRNIHVIAFATILAGALPLLAADPETEGKWISSAALGLTLTRGNSETALATGNVATSKKWDQNEISLGASATYGESKNQDDGKTEKTTETVHAFGQYNRLFNDRLFGYGRIDALHDDVADIYYRFTFSPGVGYYFIKNPRMDLSAEVGPAFIYENVAGDERGYFTLRVAERFNYKINDRARIWQSAEFLPQVDDWNNYIINAELGIESDLTEKLSLRSFVQDTYDNEPAPGRRSNDVKWVTAIAYKF